ncbi:MAG: hypothetical protein IPN33_22415 [Saprospiraceae bacterium]|nr:hypothetical protein [Saprospiraceae bacterium]
MPCCKAPTTSATPATPGPLSAFLTAHASAFQPGVQTLTGSERMWQRPIGLLVDALRQLGAQIEHLGKEGYPPCASANPDIPTPPAACLSPPIPAASLSPPC